MDFNIKEYANELYDSFLKTNLDEALFHHIENNIPLTESIFRAGSENYFRLFNIARTRLAENKISLSEGDIKLLTETDIGLFGEYEGKEVPLDYPIVDDLLSEAEYHGKEVQLNKPMRGGSKKYYVYVKNDKGNVIKVSFGDTSGLKEKISDPEARKSFAARHQCDLKKDKTKASYWSCNLPRYAKALGLSGGGNFYW